MRQALWERGERTLVWEDKGKRRRNPMPHKRKINGKWTGKWFGQVKRHGERRRKLFPSKDGAKAWKVEMQRRGSMQAFQALESKQTALVCLLDWAEKYLDYSLRYSPKTYNEKRHSFRRLLHTFGDPVPVETLQPGSVLEYVHTIFHTRSGHAALRHRKLATTERYGRGLEPVRPYLRVLEGGLFGQRSTDGCTTNEKGLRVIAS